MAELQAYDAWGKRTTLNPATLVSLYSANGWSAAPVVASVRSAITTKGFAGHETFDDVAAPLAPSVNFMEPILAMFRLLEPVCVIIRQENKDSVMKKCFLFCFLFFLGCQENNSEPSFSDMKNDIFINEKDYLYLLNFVEENKIARITYDSVYPKEISKSIDLSKFRQYMRKNNISIGVGYDKRDGYFEIMYWAAGIVGSGRYKSYIYTVKKIDQVKTLQERIDRSWLKCEIATGNWYVCEGT